MLLESAHHIASSTFVTSVHKEIQIVNNHVDDLLGQINQQSEQLNSGLNDLDNKINLDLEKLSKKCDYLKAEIWRYKKLLESFSKAESGPEMKQRILDLETAIEEHSNLKIKELKGLSAKKRALFEKDGINAINELKVKLDIAKDDFIQKIETILTGFSEYLETNINSNKGTSDLEKLIEYTIADYNHTSSSIKLGSFLHTFKNKFGEWSVEVPAIQDFCDKSNLILFYNETTKTSVENITDGIILRTLASNLPDKIQLKIFDNQFWDKFSEFLKLPNSVIYKGINLDQITSSINEVEEDIRKNLTLIWSDIQDKNQTIHEFNLKKIKSEKYDEIIPYRLFVFDNSQALIEQSKLYELLERASNLTRFGCNFIFMFNTSKSMDSEYLFHLKDHPFESFKNVDLTGTIISSDFSSDNFITKNLVNDSKKIFLESFENELHEVIINRAKLRYIEHCEQDRTKWFAGNVGNQIKMPIGKSRSSEGVEYLNFNTKDGLSNALLCGGVGSGKTNLLKSIITSVSLQYSPDQIEMYLIDLKNGAGFSIFNHQKLPHVKLYAFSAENELINDVFENLRLEMDRRYEEYSKFNIDNLADVYKDERLSLTAPKRTLVVIDEFGSLSSNGDDFLDNIFVNILAIVQRGRAMGINLLLATQNFSNIKHSAFWQAVTQIPTRIILKSSPEAAQSILAISNNASKEITRIGEGFINYNYGEINADGGNQFFKSYLLENDDLKPLLIQLREEAEIRNYNLKKSIFLDSSIEADFSENTKIREGISSSDLSYFNKYGIPCWLGESFLMNGSAHLNFHWKINNKSYDQNIVISGNEREHSIQAFFSIASSISYGIPNSNVSLKWIIPFEDDTIKDLGLDVLVNRLPNSEFFRENDLEKVLLALDNIKSERIKNQQEKFPIIVFMPGLERFVSLHRNSSYDNLLSVFNGLLNSGSSQGIYFVCEINKASSIAKLGYDVIGSFEHRIAFSMNKDDSIELINSDKASKLIDPENLTCRSKAIYYSQSSQDAIKFKSYINLKNEENLINPAFSPPDEAKIQHYIVKGESVGNKGTNIFNNIDIDSIPDDAVISLDDLINGVNEE